MKIGFQGKYQARSQCQCGRVCQIRRLIRRRCGSLSLFFCVVLAALVSVMGVWLQAARTRSFEADLARSLSAQVQVGLAGYDRNLYDQFGLFGFKEAIADQSILEGMLAAFSGHESCELTVQAARPLYDQPELKAQILTHMKARVPVIYLDVLADQLKQLTSCFPTGDNRLPAPRPGQMNLQDSPLRSLQVSNQGGNGGLAEVLKNILPDLGEDMVKGLADCLFGDLVDQLEDDLLRSVRETYRRYAADWIGIGQDQALTELLGEMPDFLDPESLTTLGGRIDQVMTFATIPVYDKFCLMEYALGYFVPRVTVQTEHGSTQPLLTLDGRKMTDLAETRSCEVERLITGIKDSHAASLVVRMAIISMRSFLQLVALLLDETRMAALRTAAVSIAAAIGVLSVGTVIFDPELLTWVLAVGEAIKAGYQDSQRLIDGRAVPVWPGRGKINFNCWYQDYLRLLLLLLPQSMVLERSGQILEQIMPGPYFTSLTAATTWRGEVRQMTAAYFPASQANSG